MFYRIRYTVAVALQLVSALFVIKGCKGTSESFSTSSPVGKPTVRPTATKIPMKKPVVQPTATKLTAVEEKVESTDVGSSNNSESDDIAYSTIFTLASDYEQFPDDIQAKFQSIVDQEFSAIKDKSGMSVAI